MASSRQAGGMASSADLECWRALGGKVTEVKKRKRFISPTGETLRARMPILSCYASLQLPQLRHPAPAGEEYSSWQAASDYLKANGKKGDRQICAS